VEDQATKGERRRATPLPARPLRWAMGAIAALVVYGNTAVALQPPRLGFVLLPRPAWLLDAFLLPGMFSSYTTTNIDFHIAALRDAHGRAEDRGRWITLELSEHFPQRLGITFTQLYLPHQREVLGAEGQRRGWETLARKIRERHNRLHPDHAVTRIKLGTVEWPIRPGGYRAGKNASTVRMRPWFVEPESP
jgi:hypothetical protein